MADPSVEVLSDIDALLSKLKHLSGGARINALSKLQECIVEINSPGKDDKKRGNDNATKERTKIAKKSTRKRKGSTREELPDQSNSDVTPEEVSENTSQLERDSSPKPKPAQRKRGAEVRSSKRRLASLPQWFNNFSDVPQFLTVQHKSTTSSSRSHTESSPTKDCKVVLERTLLNEAATNKIDDEKIDASEKKIEGDNSPTRNEEIKTRRRRKKNSANDKEENDEGKTCGICHRTYINASYLRVHMRQHTGEKPYNCELCDRKFSQKSSLWVHKKRHEGKFDHHCSECDYKSVLKIDLMRHMPKHTGARIFICDQCGKMFTTDMRLKDHIRHVHVRNETHVCDKCGFSTHRADNLRRHMTVKHSDDELFKCPVCGDMLKQRWTFIVHLRRHTGERPHSCTECGKGFKSLSQLAVHRRTHREGEHTCHDCGRKFKTKHHLVRHSVIHSGLKPFSCSYCPYTCNVKGNINKHMKAVHKLANFSFKTINKNERANSTKVTDEQSAIARGQQVTQEFLERISLRKDEQLTVEALQQQLPKPSEDDAAEPVITCRRYRNRDSSARKKSDNEKNCVDECTEISDGQVIEDINENLIAANTIALPANDGVEDSNIIQIDENKSNNETGDLLLLSVKHCLGDQMTAGIMEGGQNAVMTLPIQSSQLSPTDQLDVNNGSQMIYVIRVVP